MPNTVVQAALAFLMLQTPVDPVDPGEVVSGELAARVDDYMTRLEAHGFAGTVLVADRDGIRLAKGYGEADREAGIPVRTDTVFTVGSITKQFTAAAILLLEQRGELSVDDPLEVFFEDVPADKQDITLHDLLTHGSGLASDFAGDFEQVGRDEYVRRILASELLFEPGDGFNYANSGFSLLGAVVEIVSGRDYETFLREELFLPAGMADTGYVLPGWAPERIARGYQATGEWGTVVERMPPEGPYWALRANGGIHSTLGDMYRWHLALSGDELLSPESKEKLYGRHNPEGGGSYYGYGWSIEDTPYGTLITHNGGNTIFAADFLRYVDEGVTIYMTSSTPISATRVSRRVSALVHGADVELPPAVVDLGERLALYAGDYCAEDGAAVAVRAEGSALILEARDPRAFALVMGDQPPPGSGPHQLMVRSLAAVEASAAGDYAPLAEILAAPLERVAEREEEAFAELRSELGELKQITLLGAADGPLLRVTLALEFERGTRYAVHGWEGRTVGSLRLTADAPARRVRPASETEFLEHDPVRGTTWSTGFELGDDGRPAALVFETWKGPVRVPRAVR